MHLCFYHAREFLCLVLTWCSDSQVEETKATMPQLLATVANLTERLGPFQYLNSNGLYNALHLKQLSEELHQLQNTVEITHNDNPSEETIKLTKDVCNYTIH